MNLTTTTTTTSLQRTIPPGIFVFFLVLGIMLIMWLYGLFKNSQPPCCNKPYYNENTESPMTEYPRAWFYTIETHPQMETCPICLSDNKKKEKIVKLLCGHEFHENCVTTWLENNPMAGCPLCRAECRIMVS